MKEFSMFPKELLVEIFKGCDFNTKKKIRQACKVYRLMVDSLIRCYWKYYPTKENYWMFFHSTLPLPHHFSKLVMKMTHPQSACMDTFFIPSFITTVEAIVRIQDQCQFIRRLPCHIEQFTLSCPLVRKCFACTPGTFGHFSNLRCVELQNLIVSLTDTLPNTLQKLDVLAFGNEQDLRFLPPSLTHFTIRNANWLTSGLVWCNKDHLPNLKYFHLYYSDHTLSLDNVCYIPTSGAELSITLESCAVCDLAATTLSSLSVTNLHILHYRKSRTITDYFFPSTVQTLYIFGNGISVSKLAGWMSSAINLKTLEISLCSSLSIHIMRFLPNSCKVKTFGCRYFGISHMKQYPQLEVVKVEQTTCEGACQLAKSWMASTSLGVEITYY